jgi:hypothetical protein
MRISAVDAGVEQIRIAARIAVNQEWYAEVS